MRDFFNPTRAMGRAQYVLMVFLAASIITVGEWASDSGDVVVVLLLALCALGAACAALAAMFRRAADLGMHWRMPLIIMPLSVASEIALTMGKDGFLEAHLWLVTVL